MSSKDTVVQDDELRLLALSTLNKYFSRGQANVLQNEMGAFDFDKLVQEVFKIDDRLAVLETAKVTKMEQRLAALETMVAESTKERQLAATGQDEADRLTAGPSMRYEDNTSQLAGELSALKVRLDRLESKSVQHDEKFVGGEDLKTKTSEQMQIETPEDGSEALDPAACASRSCAEVLRQVEYDIDTYTFQESVWDALFLHWYHFAGMWDVTVMAVLYISNVALQLLMCTLVYINMSQAARIDDRNLDDLLTWRLSVSQSFLHYHQESNTSFATRVCSGDGARILGDGQARALLSISEFIIDNKPLNGPLLLGCALLIWLLLVNRENVKVFEFTCALFAIRTSTQCHGTWEEGDQFTINGASTSGRLFAILLITIPRFVLVAGLKYAGLLYLVNSETMGDLILNCIALGFILDIDELLYAYVPKRSAFKLSCTCPINLQSLNLFKSHHGLDLGRLFSFSMLLLIIPEVFLTWWFAVGPLIEKLEQAYTIICGGKTNLVFTVDKSHSVEKFAVTASEKVPLSPEYNTIAVMQAIELQQDARLSELLKDWPQPSIKYAQKTNLENLDQLFKQTDLEAISQQPCLDLDYDEPGRASLKTITGMSWCNEADAYNMSGRCNESVVRKYCPVACFCTAASWWPNREGCPPTCETPYREYLKQYLKNYTIQLHECDDHRKGQGHGLPDMAPHGGDLVEYTKDVHYDLIRDGKLSESGQLLEPFRELLKDKSLNQCIFSKDARIDPVKLVNSSTHRQQCNIIMLIDSIFDIGLCDTDFTRFRKGSGNIAAYCPDSCRVCPNKDYSPEKPKTIMDIIYVYTKSIYRKFRMWGPVKRFLKCGYEWIFCGESRRGTLESGFMLEGGKSKIYRFYAEKAKFYSFKVIPASYNRRVYLKIYVYDYQLQLTRQNLLFEAKSWKSFGSGGSPAAGHDFTNAILSDIVFDESGVHHLLVWATTLSTNDFTVSIRANDTSCSRSIPMQIRCGEILNGSLVKAHEGQHTELDVTGKPGYPEKIFRFQAAAGIEYTFDTCGSSIATTLRLYDGYLSDPPLIYDQKSSSQSCTQSERGHFVKHFEDSAEYAVVVEAQCSSSLGLSGVCSEGGDIRLSMQCN